MHLFSAMNILKTKFGVMMKMNDDEQTSSFSLGVVCLENGCNAFLCVFVLVCLFLDAHKLKNNNGRRWMFCWRIRQKSKTM